MHVCMYVCLPSSLLLKRVKLEHLKKTVFYDSESENDSNLTRMYISSQEFILVDNRHKITFFLSTGILNHFDHF